MTSDAPILETRSVQRTFMVSQGLFRGKKPLRAVIDVSLRLDRGEVLGLVGESGCGKTTLAMMLLGLLQPSGGEILLGGQPLEAIGRWDISKKIQPVFQDPYSSLNPRKTVKSIVSLPLKVHHLCGKAERRRLTYKMLNVAGLPSRVAHSYPNQLSGGQRQRVAIARALIMRPEVVICDEPTSALDVSVQSQILNLITDLRKEFGLTYILISHNLAVIEHMATRVAVMYLGRIVEEARTARIFHKPRHPYTRTLLDSMLTLEPGKGLPKMRLTTGFPNPIDPPAGCTFHPRCAKAIPICREQIPPLLADACGRVACFLRTPAEVQ